jgi:putative endonuclease
MRHTPTPSEEQPPESSPRKPWYRRWFGNRSERAATRFLKRLGYRIVARNYTCPSGELDIVAVDGTTLVFVEVRSTGSDDVARPASSVDLEKQRRVTELALYFMQTKRLLGRHARFDVLAISWPSGRREPEIVHYPHAFEAVGRFQMFN